MYCTKLITAFLLSCVVSPVFSAVILPKSYDVRIDSGPISGVWSDDRADVRVYKGIPYAAAPVDDLRWQAPTSPQPWQEVRTCHEFAKGCVQAVNKLGFGGPDEAQQSEDCLYLNVWTAAKARESRPVMFFVHGGGYNTGSGSEPSYEGSALARKGVVVVTFNYRLNVLGFFAHPWLSAESNENRSGNYGALDMIAALKWVKRNISQFGGDPNNITVFGESAGAGGVLTLMTSPLSRHLFQKAIIQSGVPTGIGMPLRGKGTTAENLGQQVTDALGIDTLEELRSYDAHALCQAYVKLHKTNFFGEMVSSGPIIDGYVLLERPLLHVQNGDCKHLKLMIGTNADEATVFMPHFPIKGEFGYRMVVNKYFDQDAADILRMFPVIDKRRPKAPLCELIGIAMFIAPSRLMARKYVHAGGEAYLYHLTRVPPETRRIGLGAMHGLDISYIFGTGKVLNTEIDKQLSRNMIRAWSSFAQSGVPVLPEGLEWPLYHVHEDQHVEFGDSIQIQSQLHKDACDLFEKRFMRLLEL